MRIEIQEDLMAGFRWFLWDGEELLEEGREETWGDAHLAASVGGLERDRK